jgi:Flp pilus assembly protein TadD
MASLLLAGTLLLPGCNQPGAEVTEIAQSDNPQEMNRAGLELLRQGDPDRAASAFKRALALDPEYPEALSNLGASLLKQGQIDEAIEALEKAIELKPDFQEALALLAMAHELKGDKERASAVFAQLSELNENPVPQQLPFAVQVAAEEDLAAAIALANRLSDRYEPEARVSRVKVNGKWLYRVRIPVASLATAQRLAGRLQAEEQLEAWIARVE